jgi:hypothetical protein
MGVKVWPEVYFAAGDALASAAAIAANDERVGQVLICTPDKDLGQCVAGNGVVQLERRRDILRDEAGVIEKFGVRPATRSARRGPRLKVRGLKGPFFHLVCPLFS